MVKVKKSGIAIISLEEVSLTLSQLELGGILIFSVIPVFSDISLPNRAIF